VIGLQGIRARKTRTVLAMVSIFLGVLAVVVVQAGAELARQAALTDIELQVGKDGTRMVTLPAGDKVTAATMDTLTGRPGAVAAMTFMATLGEPDVTSINPGGSPFNEPAQDVPGGVAPIQVICEDNRCTPVFDQQPDAPPPKGQAIDLSLNALTGDIRQFRPFRPVAGQWLDFSGPPTLSPRIVVNKEAAKGLTRYRVPAQLHIVGATADLTPRIIGVIDDGQAQPNAYARADEVLGWFPNRTIPNTQIQVSLAPTARDTERVLQTRLVSAGLPAGQMAVTTVHSREQIESRLAVLRLIFLGLAGLVLLIGTAGILNVGLATVGERVDEFALRRAVGTARVLLAGIVLAETLLTGLFTAAVAILAASQGLQLISRLYSPNQPALQHIAFPWQAGVAGIVAGLAAGAFGGLIPAIRAARIPIATVMRA
jgi:putative ABC transport system permease protein